MKLGHHTLKKTVLTAAITTALGVAIVPQEASALTKVFSWTGKFTMLDGDGQPLANTSITGRGVNQYQTPITGTLTYDTVTGTGSMTITPFGFFASPASQPATATGITIQAIGDGTCTNNDPAQGCNPGNLWLGNMLFDWNGNYGIPLSIVWDASGLLPLLGTLGVGDVVSFTDPAATVSPAAGAVPPSSDGTYTNASFGYLNLGPLPVATTSWNVTPVSANCASPNPSVPGAFEPPPTGCMTVSPSGILPLVADTRKNLNKSYNANVYGIAGIPMWDGPFLGFNASFDLESMTLTDDGLGPAFTTPPDPVDPNPVIPSVPDTVVVNLGTVTDEAATTVIEYSLDGGATWTVDDGVSNPITVNITQTVNVVNVTWRGTDPNFASARLGSQTVTVTVNDTVNPVFTGFPADVVVNVNSTADTVTFETAGTVQATDNIELASIEWSLDGLNWNTDNPAADETSNAFGAGANIVYWRATDASGNTVTQQQTVTLNLPTGIVGQPCQPDPDLLNAAIGQRMLEGIFTMRDPNGGLVGTIDTAVSGYIDTAKVCADETCTVSGAALVSPTPFFGELWVTNTIRLFNNPGTYTFNTVQDGNPPLSMTVGPGQLGAHMLFDWSINKDIDVVLVWDYDCGASELISTDPDGDGIIGTKMVDGPFKGFSAAFDLATKAGERPITTGGYSVTVPVVKNSTPNSSPLPVSPGSVGTVLGGVQFGASDLFDTFGASDDSAVVTSCAGGCFDFEVAGLAPGATTQVVLPLSEPIPWYSVFRKYDANTDSWKDFVTDANDNIMTAGLDDNGRCPEPGAGDYTPFSSGVLEGMLRPGDQCIQVTITDGGPNDDNPAAGVVSDPAGVGVTSGPDSPEAATTGGGGCALGNASASGVRGDWWLLAGFLAFVGWFRRKAQR